MTCISHCGSISLLSMNVFACNLRSSVGVFNACNTRIISLFSRRYCLRTTECYCILVISLKQKTLRPLHLHTEKNKNSKEYKCVAVDGFCRVRQLVQRIFSSNMGKMSKKKQQATRTLLRLPEEEENIGEAKRRLSSPETQTVPARRAAPISQSCTTEIAPAAAISASAEINTQMQAYVDEVQKNSPQNLSLPNLNSAMFVSGELRSDQQAYLVDKETSNLLVFKLTGEAADAVLCSCDLKGARSTDTKLDRYKMCIDPGGPDLQNASNAMSHCVEMVKASDVMKALQRETHMEQSDIEVVAQGATSVYFQIFNSAGSFHKPRNILSRFLIPENKAMIRMPPSFHASPMPLVLDEDGNRLMSSYDIYSEYNRTRVTVYFNIIGSFYARKLHIKPRMLLVKRHAPDVNVPLAKRLRADILI